MADVLDMAIKHANASGIVYCQSKAECEGLFKYLVERGVLSAYYHADLSDAERDTVQDDRSSGKTTVICAKTAFGMGVNKPDVLYVIHFSVPKSIASYYQESGRAGRDDKEADCVLFYYFNDVCQLKLMQGRCYIIYVGINATG